MNVKTMLYCYTNGITRNIIQLLQNGSTCEGAIPCSTRSCCTRVLSNLENGLYVVVGYCVM